MGLKVVVLPLELGALGKGKKQLLQRKVLSLLEGILCLYPSGASDWEGFIYTFSDLP